MHRETITFSSTHTNINAKGAHSVNIIPATLFMQSEF